jgi:hypothetical protein
MQTTTIHAIECARTRSEHTIYWRFARVGNGTGPDCSLNDVTSKVAAGMHINLTERGCVALPRGTSLVSDVAALLSRALSQTVEVKVLSRYTNQP